MMGMLVAISGECSEVEMFSIGRQWGQGEGHKKEGSENDRTLTLIFKEAIWDKESIVYKKTPMKSLQFTSSTTTHRLPRALVPPLKK